MMMIIIIIYIYITQVTVNTGVKATHRVWQRTFWKKFWKEIKINQNWSVEKDVSHLLFLQVSCTHQPVY